MNTILVRRKWEPYLWLLPSVLLMTVFVIFPILIVFKLSFSEITKAGVVGGFIGFANFQAALADPKPRRAPYLQSCAARRNSPRPPTTAGPSSAPMAR